VEKSIYCRPQAVFTVLGTCGAGQEAVPGIWASTVPGGRGLQAPSVGGLPSSIRGGFSDLSVQRLALKGVTLETLEVAAVCGSPLPSGSGTGLREGEPPLAARFSSNPGSLILAASSDADPCGTDAALQLLAE